ncbi:putative transposase [Streptomyces albus]|uniref:Putative transposase n=1 Tax=Streptomyces albus (strain ATCC 21838 / DSM 41398 / FERM P-419 / JCM 4703 / NBRC 107858) TaxID=1081613 RepID=A0A0B5F653_STRA4|nr:putative transposase [Streptomyces albus]AOU81395.1 putative transposase [Streptomyces albus]AYN37088.1 putative transposase [Streptomyces albus]
MRSGGRPARGLRGHPHRAPRGGPSAAGRGEVQHGSDLKQRMTNGLDRLTAALAGGSSGGVKVTTRHGEPGKGGRPG